MIAVICATWTRKISHFNLLEIILVMIFCTLKMSCLVILRVWSEIEEIIFVIFYCCIYYVIIYACLLELVLTNTCVNIYCVFYCYFLNTCHLCIHIHRLISYSGRGTLYEHWIHSQPFYNIDLFVTLGGMPLPLHATSIILPFVHDLISMLPDMVYGY